jgi:hypothetical protein
MRKDQQPRYASNEEAAIDGYYQDPPPIDDIQYHPPEIDVFSSLFPIIFEGVIYEAPSGVIYVDGEELKLPPHQRQTAQIVGPGLDGLFHARPARPDEIGGGLETGKPPAEFSRTHHKASHQVLNLPK